jgi:hypothetical protein
MCNSCEGGAAIADGFRCYQTSVAHKVLSNWKALSLGIDIFLVYWVWQVWHQMMHVFWCCFSTSSLGLARPTIQLACTIACLFWIRAGHNNKKLYAYPLECRVDCCGVYMVSQNAFRAYLFHHGAMCLCSQKKVQFLEDFIGLSSLLLGLGEEVSRSYINNMKIVMDILEVSFQYAIHCRKCYKGFLTWPTCYNLMRNMFDIIFCIWHKKHFLKRKQVWKRQIRQLLKVQKTSYVVEFLFKWVKSSEKEWKGVLAFKALARSIGPKETS